MADIYGASSGVAAASSSTGAVIDEKLLRECIYIEGNVRPGLGEDAAHAKPTGPTYGAAAARGKLGRAAAGMGALPPQPTGPQRVVELHEVTSLMLSFRRISGIDNLVGVDRLTKLHLDNNNISRIENLGHLRHLKWLDLSFNKIEKIEGLESLHELEDLSLYANRITTVDGLDSQKKLMCLSLGRNRIDALEDVAKYLHRFKHLRMLTLAGNRIEQQAQYRQRILGYVDRLRFLDSRAVFEAEKAKAADDLKEHLLPIVDADKKEEEEARERKQLEQDAAEYELLNCPDDRTFHQDILSQEPEGRIEGRTIGAVLRLDNIHDRVKEILDPFVEKFTQKAKDLTDEMRKISLERRSDMSDYQLTLTRNKAKTETAAKDAIRAFEKKLKAVIPHGLKARPEDSPDDISRLLANLRHELGLLQTDLMELEADTQDAHESLNKAVDDAMEKYKTDATETLNSKFEDFRGLEKKMSQDLRLKLEGWHDDKASRMGDAGGVGDDFGSPLGGEGQPRDKQAIALLENREELSKALTEWHELHTKKLDEREQLHVKREEEGFKQMQARNAQEEHDRNRWRVVEISEYIARRMQQLDQWERDAM